MATQTKFPTEEKGSSSLIRPKFNAGQFLQDDDLTQGVTYAQDMVRLLFRSMLGCGVLCGLKVTATLDCGKLVIVVARGVALTCTGAVVEVPVETTTTIDPTCGAPLPPMVWITLCTDEKGCAPRETQCTDEDDPGGMATTRIREGFAIRIYDAEPDDVCGCASPPDKDPANDCYAGHVAGECACGCDCACVMLARVAPDDKGVWQVDHGVRRFIRPMLLPDPLLAKATTPPPPPPAPVVGTPARGQVTTIQFDKGANPTAAGKAALDTLVAAIKAGGKVSITVTGFADTSANGAPNLQLSDRRSKAVVDALVAAGVPRAYIATVASGSADPVGVVGSGSNQRVEVTVTPQPAP